MKRFKKAMLSAACALSLATGAVTTPNASQAGTSPYLGDVMIVAFTFCPRGWLPMDGQLLPINQNQSLYSLLGTRFGGDGRTSFGLPDTRGRVTVGHGTGPGAGTRVEGQTGGLGYSYMTTSTMPSHSHTVRANNLDGDKPGPGGKLLAAAPPGGAGTETIYSTEAATVDMNAEMLTQSGNSAIIYTADPTLGLLHCMAVSGTFPPRP